MKKYLVSMLVLLAVTAFAGTVANSNGKIILTISGKIQSTQDGQQAKFDLKQLQKLPSDTFTLQTRWDSDVHKYHGPLLSAVLKEVGIQGKQLRLRALNDYTIDVDVAYIEKYQPILAWQVDGKTMSVRNKGPLWLLLPHDKYPELNDEVHTGRMIWQLSHIEVR